MGQILTPLDIRQLGDGMWLILSDFQYQPDSGEVITVPEGFETDLQSIPKFAWSFVGSPADEYAEAGVVHDWLYRHPASGLVASVRPRRRRRCDEVYLEVNIDEDCPWRQRTAKHWVVRLLGWRPWRRYRKADRKRTAGDIVTEKAL